MIQLVRKPLIVLLAFAATAAPTAPTPFENESLRYSVNWPSGLGLGEAQLRASHIKATADSGEKRHLEFEVDAAVPGFAVSDRYRSDTSADFCSIEFQKTVSHGSKKADEKTTFDQQAGTATRETAKGGGKTEMKMSQCGKDALAYLYFVRRELAQGRIPQRQTVFFGGAYEARMEFKGTQSIRIGEAQMEADRMTGTVKGTASEVTFEVFFLKDAARTPALVRVPLTLGTFSMELIK